MSTNLYRKEAFQKGFEAVYGKTVYCILIKEIFTSMFIIERTSNHSLNL